MAGEAQNEKHRDQESLIHYLSATSRASPDPGATATARRQYAGSVVSRDTVRILLMIMVLNNLDVKVFNISNTYLNADTDEEVFAGKLT